MNGSMHPFELDEGQIRLLLSSPGHDNLSKISRFEPYFDQPAQPAAVLIPFVRPFGIHSPWHILLTRRTELVADHKGQVAYPGGRKENSDPDMIFTALREAQEEIGIDPKQVRIVGVLGKIQTITNFLVTPIVGVLPWPYPVKLQTREVSRIFLLPLSWLADPANFHIHIRKVSFQDSPTEQTLRVIYYKPYHGEVLWGVSAEITHLLIEKLKLTK